ncbi:MAG: endoglucanase Acf2 [Cyclobacteriaceae bacterium]|jgi:endoglucanase Acf2
MLIRSLLSVIIPSLCFCNLVVAQTVSVGSASYTTEFPGVDEAGRNGFPGTAPLVSGIAATKPIPTNDWWSSLLKNDIFGGSNAFAENLFNYPLSMKTNSAGLMVTYIPFGVIDDQQPIIVGVSGLNASKSTVSDYTDWTVTMDWDNRFQAVSGIGMPFLYFNKGDVEIASVTINLGTVNVSGEVITVTDARNGADFAVYAPAGSVWTNEGNTYTSELNGENYWSMAMLPQGETDVAAVSEEYKKYAYVFPANTTVAWNYDESTSVVRTDFVVETDVKEGAGNNMLLGLLPHQWDNLANDSAVPDKYLYKSVRGDMKTLEGNTFSVENSFSGILPTLPYLTNYSDGFSLSALNEKVELMENDQLATWTDSYNEGQVMNRLIQTARIADEMGNTTARDKMLETIKERLEDWLTFEGGEVAFLFYYNADWTAMLGYPAGHGQDTNINDHHFHWGYFIHAAAFLEQYEPGWAEEWGDMIDLLIRDAASPNRTDELFPFLRNFSPYAGHCWANGMAAFPQGNDQESTSESMQFNSSLIHWGAITGNDEIRDLGIYLYTTEQSAVEEYWFDIEERIFPDNQFSVVSRVWGNSYDNGTFWTSDIEASYGIELYPIHGGSLYLGHNTDYAEKLWAEIEQNTGILQNDDNVNLWHDTMWKYLSLTDPEKAIALYDSHPNRTLKFGVSDAQTYYWLHAMNAMGRVDAAVTADYPIAVAFQKNGVYTYTAHNYSNVDIDVTFSDGYVLSVPASSMATNRDLRIAGQIQSSFNQAYPGGSVELALTADGDSPTKVEFYDDGQLIGEDIDAPFSFQATNLSPAIHRFYAKLYVGEDFGVSNIVAVQVGNQTPYEGINQIPGTIEPGKYDRYESGNGQGITYSDVSTNNEGNFRTDEAVDVLNSTAEGATIGWISGGEWVEYTVEVNSSGLYDMSFRYASGNQGGGGPFSLAISGETISEDISVSSTGDWDTWQTGEVTDLALTEGQHILRLVFYGGEFNIGRLTFEFKAELPYSQPVANAGETVTVLLPATTGSLDGSMSIDPADDPLTFLWTQIYGPSFISFSDVSIASPDISNLSEGVYLCRLTVSDGMYDSFDEVLITVSESGNISPSVYISSPSANDAFRTDASILISAKANDLEGPVAQVEFLVDNASIGVDNEAPFEMSFLNPSVGEHVISAIATDDMGATGASSTVTILVNEVFSCIQSSSESQEGSFSTGYKASFEAVGSDVIVTFELLDTNKPGLFAFLRQGDPFTEVQMTQVAARVFSTTFRNHALASELTLACKFEFTGGLAVTKNFTYSVGEVCEEEVEEIVPLSIDDHSLPSVYPNPVRDRLTINWNGYESGTLHALDGSLVLTAVSQDLFLGDLEQGIYLLILTGSDGQQQTIKVIKQ